MKVSKKEEGPDQARSWAVAMAGCVINSLLSGINRTTGLFYVALIETYGVSRMEANMPFTLRNIARNLLGPVAGAIGQRYGGRVVTFAGGVFASAGIALCCFAPNVTWISILWGGIHGIGAAFGLTLFPVVINQYFLKYRATASGLSFSGACIGSLVFPFVTEYMLRNIGLPGTFLITGGLIMHVLPAAILMAEPPWAKRKEGAKLAAAYNGKNDSKRKFLRRVQNFGKMEVSEEVSVVSTQRTSGATCEDLKNTERSFQPASNSVVVFSQIGVDNPAFDGSKAHVRDSNGERLKEEQEEVRLRTTVSNGDTSNKFSEQLGSEAQEASLKRGILKIIRDPMFHVLSISFAANHFLLDTAVIVIVDYLQDKGLDNSDAKYLISIIALGDFVGRLCFGWVTDRNYMSVPKFMLVVQVIQGICFLLLPPFYSFNVLTAVIMIFGLGSGATEVRFPILVSKYLASVQLLAIGSIAIFSGILALAVPLLIGYFRDNGGSYDGMFLIMGSLSVVVGCVWLFEPLLVRLQKRSLGDSIVISA